MGTTIKGYILKLKYTINMDLHAKCTDLDDSNYESFTSSQESFSLLTNDQKIEPITTTCKSRSSYKRKARRQENEQYRYAAICKINM